MSLGHETTARLLGVASLLFAWRVCLFCCCLAQTEDLAILLRHVYRPVLLSCPCPASFSFFPHVSTCVSTRSYSRTRPFVTFVGLVLDPLARSPSSYIPPPRRLTWPSAFPHTCVLHPQQVRLSAVHLPVCPLGPRMLSRMRHPICRPPASSLSRRWPQRQWGNRVGSRAGFGSRARN